MTQTNLHMMDAALIEASKQLMRAAGQDERLSPREFRQRLTQLSGEMRDLTEALYQFVVDIDKQGANHITERDIENAVARVRAEIFPQYTVSETVMGAEAQKTVQAIAPKTALNLALQIYQTARASQVLPAAQVFQFIQAYAPGLIFDFLASESSNPIEAVHIPVNLTSLTQETFAAALGLEADKPEEQIARFREAASFFPLFVRFHADFELEEQAQALVDVMQNNLRQHVLAVIGEDNVAGPEHPVYVVGLAADGSLVGFRSIIIWT